MRATICVNVDTPDELTLVESWFARWRPRLNYVSKDIGCGCCVHIWDVDGPAEAIAELPQRVQADSAYTNGDEAAT